MSLESETVRQIAIRLLNPSSHDVGTGIHSWRLSQTLLERHDVFDAMSKLDFTGDEDRSMVKNALTIMAPLQPETAALMFSRWCQAGHDGEGLLTPATLAIPAMENAVATHIKFHPEQTETLHRGIVLPMIDHLITARAVTGTPERQKNNVAETLDMLGQLAYSQRTAAVAEINQKTLEKILETCFEAGPIWRNGQSPYDLEAVGLVVGMLIRQGATARRSRVVAYEQEDGNHYIKKHADLACEALWRASKNASPFSGTQDVMGALIAEGGRWDHLWDEHSPDPEQNARLEQIRMATPGLVRERLGERVVEQRKRGRKAPGERM